MPLGRTMAQVLSNPLSTRYALSLTFLLNLSPQRTFPLMIDDGCQTTIRLFHFATPNKPLVGAPLSPLGDGRLRSLAVRPLVMPCTTGQTTFFFCIYTHI